MKRVLCFVMVAFILCGCRGGNQDIQPAMDMRNRLKNANGYSFDAEITADYGDEFYTFTMRCTADTSGAMEFEVLKPDSISGITGNISGDKGALSFDDKVLAFDTLADGYISPIASPWVMTNSLISGYITSCGVLEDGYRISLNDSYADDALEMDVWIDQSGKPIRCEILYKERRCLSLDVKNFTYL